MRQLRSLRAEAVIYVGGGRGVRAVHRDVAFFRVAGLRRVIGAPLTHDLDANRPDPATGLLEPEAARLARCLAELGPIDLADPKAWDLRLTAQEIARADEILGKFRAGPFIAVNTAENCRLKIGEMPIGASYCLG